MEHRAHLLGILPYLLVLACPLMHLFHHRGHGGHGQNPQDKDNQPASQTRDETNLSKGDW